MRKKNIWWKYAVVNFFAFFAAFFVFSSTPRLKTNAVSPLSTNITAYYSFDENTGTAVNDVIGTNHGIWKGTTGTLWANGRIRSAGNYNGTGRWVEVTSQTAVDFEK